MSKDYSKKKTSFSSNSKQKSFDQEKLSKGASRSNPKSNERRSSDKFKPSSLTNKTIPPKKYRSSEGKAVEPINPKKFDKNSAENDPRKTSSTNYSSKNSTKSGYSKKNTFNPSNKRFQSDDESSKPQNSKNYREHKYASNKSESDQKPKYFSQRSFSKPEEVNPERNTNLTLKKSKSFDNYDASEPKKYRDKNIKDFGRKKERSLEQKKKATRTYPPTSNKTKLSSFRKESLEDITEDDLKSIKKNNFLKTTSSKAKNTISPTNDGLLRLNRYISNSGICSRRDADDLISQGLITVNGEVITELGFKVRSSDTVKYEGRILNPEKMRYVLLNKPKDFITTMDDPEDRKTVMDLVKNACKERVYPVGRLDRNTTGLLLLTNDGELAEKLTHPSHQISKIYQVDLDKPIQDSDVEKIVKGVYLEDGMLNVIDIAVISPDKKILGIEISEGRNRVVRRLFETLGYEVVRLDRVSYAGLTKKDLPRGNWRMLSEKEVALLKNSAKKSKR